MRGNYADAASLIAELWTNPGQTRRAAVLVSTCRWLSAGPRGRELITGKEAFEAEAAFTRVFDGLREKSSPRAPGGISLV